MMEPLNLSKLSNTHHSLHLLTKFLGSVFFFSVFILCSSLFPFLFNFIQFCSSNIGKNYMFLLCNGILVFIVKNSGLMGNSHEEINLINNGGNPKKTEVKTEENVIIDVKEEQEMESKSKCLINVPLITQDMEDEIAATIDEDQEEGEEEEEEEEEIGLLSAEELNKKCEDFIRKMKEGIKFEA